MPNSNRPLDEITGEIVDAAYQPQKGFGPGLLEPVYETVLARDLERRGLRADGLHFENCLRIDLIVEARVVVEIKSVDHTLPIRNKQLLTHLRRMRLPVGLLINSGKPTLGEGLQRIVHDLRPSASPALRVNRSSGQARA